MAKENISKKEIYDKLIDISKSSRILGAEGLVVDIDEIITAIEKDL